MNEITPDSIEPATRGWFGNQLQGLAMRHDLVGPNISLINDQVYKAQLIDELASRARAAVASKELQCTDKQIEIYCPLAADELIRLRQIRAAHKAGELSTDVLRQLPAYEAFRDYFDEAPSLVRDQVIAAAKDLFASGSEDADSEPLSQPGHPAHPVSEETRQWMERQVTGSHAAQHGFGVFLIRQVLSKCFLVTEGFLRLARGHQQTVINAVSELPDQCGLIAKHQLQHFQWCRGNVLDTSQAGGIETGTRLWTDAGQPFVGQRMKKADLATGNDLTEGGWLVEFRSDRTDQFVRGDALADIDFQLLPDGFPDRQRDFGGRFFAVGRQIEITFVNRRLFHVRCEVVTVPKHPV